MRKKYLLIGVLGALLVLLVVLLFTLKPKTKVESPYPNLTLIGEAVISLEEGAKYQEPGYKAEDTFDGNITDRVEISQEPNTNKSGVYEIVYSVTNSKGKKARAKRIVKVQKKETPIYKDEYDSIDNTVKGWGLKYHHDGTKPDLDMSKEELKKYNAYALGVEDKVIYLTFDEGTLETYLDEIVGILDANDVKATFFLCKTYIENNGELLKKMLEKGHSIGNHTASHPSMPTLATKESYSKYIEELKSTEKAFQEVTGTEMEKLYREPKGEYSLRSLTLAKDLGYKTYFWSAAYQDWDDSLGKEKTLETMFDRVHDGAIYLLHSTSKSNYLALDEFIKTMKNKGYRFDLVKNIP